MIIDIVKKIAVFLLILFFLFQLSFYIVFFSSGTEFSDLPFPRAYAHYFTKLFTGRLQLNGGSGNLSFIQCIKDKLPDTIGLCLFSLLFALVIGLFLGVIAGFKLHSWPNKLINTFGLIIASCPIVWIAVLIIYNLSEHHFFLPDSGALIEPIYQVTGFPIIDIILTPGINKFQEFLKELQYLILPVVILSTYPSIITIQLVSQQVDHVTRKNYITTIRIREQSHWKILFRHILPNVLPPILPKLTYNLSLLLFYAMLIEIIFDRPGLGSWALDAFIAKNNTIIATILILCGIIICTLNLISDLITIIIRPLRNKELYNESI